MIGNYILKNKIPVRVYDIVEWGTWFESNSRRVAEDIIGDTRISTVFLGIDHSFWGGIPILFETMVFGGEHDGYQERYCTWEQAEKGHQGVIELVSRREDG